METPCIFLTRKTRGDTSIAKQWKKRRRNTETRRTIPEFGERGDTEIRRTISEKVGRGETRARVVASRHESRVVEFRAC